MTRGAAAYSADGAVVPLLQNTPQLFAHGTHEQREERKGLFTHSLTGSGEGRKKRRNHLRNTN